MKAEFEEIEQRHLRSDGLPETPIISRVRKRRFRPVLIWNAWEMKNLEIGVSTKLIVTARIRGNVLREKKILKKKFFEETKL